MPSEHFDAVVVGSGFGGSVMAYRLAEAGMRVCLLERGRAFPPGSFPRDPVGMKDNFWDPSAGLYGMFNVWSFRHIESLVSAGLGGGSLIYANVLLRKDEKWFVRERPAEEGYENWVVTRADLDPHYDQVERMMAAQRYPLDHDPYDGTLKTLAMRDSARRLGLEWQLLNLAVTFRNPGEEPVPGEPIREEHRNLHDRTRYTCRLCGECDVGCNYGSKNTLDYNYLSEAKRLGAELRTLSEVRSLVPRSGGGYAIQYVRHDPARTSATARPVEITTDTLVISAGTMGSTYLLLKNRTRLPGLSPALGSHFCGNGDLLTFAVDAMQTKEGKRNPRKLNGSFGPVITSAIRMGDEADGAPHSGRGFYIEDAGYPFFLNWIVESADRRGLLKRVLDLTAARVRSTVGLQHDTDLGSEISRLLGPCTLSSCSVPMLGMGRDVPNGRFFLEEDQLENDWKIEKSDPYFERMRDTMHAMAKSWGARFLDNLVWHLGKRVITVHPLGGCPMGRDDREGVVDAWGEVYNHPGLYVADGSVMPGPTGANPSLTIAAMSNRFADRIIEKRRKGSGAREPVPALKVVGPGAAARPEGERQS
jgi:cholesterol oxidase